MATPAIRDLLNAQGEIARPAPQGEAPHPFTKRLIEEAREHLLLRSTIAISIPVHIIHGKNDTQIPFARSLLLTERPAASDVTLELVAAGDHHLSRPADLARLDRAVIGLKQRLAAPA